MPWVKIKNFDDHFYRDHLVKVTILGVGLGAMLWDYFGGNRSIAPPALIYTIIGVYVAFTGCLLVGYFRAKKLVKKRQEEQSGGASPGQ